MTQQLDEKKHIIVPLLFELRRYNSEIGDYDKSMMNMNFDYSVKLTNGNIQISQELVYDYERAKQAITEDRYQIAATRFVIN
jgi:hypothetical protein